MIHLAHRCPGWVPAVFRPKSSHHGLHRCLHDHSRLPTSRQCFHKHARPSCRFLSAHLQPGEICSASVLACSTAFKIKMGFNPDLSLVLARTAFDLIPLELSLKSSIIGVELRQCQVFFGPIFSTRPFWKELQHRQSSIWDWVKRATMSKV